MRTPSVCWECDFCNKRETVVGSPEDRSLNQNGPKGWISVNKWSRDLALATGDFCCLVCASDWIKI